MTEIDAKFLNDCIAQAAVFRDEALRNKDYLMYSYYKGHYDALTKIQLNCVDNSRSDPK